MSNDAQHKSAALEAALRWQVEHGADAAIGEEPLNRKAIPAASPLSAMPKEQPQSQGSPEQAAPPADRFTQEGPPIMPAAEGAPPTASPNAPPNAPRGRPPSTAMLGSAAAKLAAEKAALGATTLEELRAAIANFDGLSIRETAMNMVFSDGNPNASVMLVGEAPGGDEDRLGKPFVGASGQLLDKLLGYIGLSRASEKPEDAVYISNIVNWRPPGNRTPTPQEMDICLPFIERHICLVKPKILLLVGNVPTKTLLQSKEGIMKLRGTWVPYQPQHEANRQLLEGHTVFALPTFHPAFLLRAPMNKKTVWFDFITLQQKREELGLATK